MLHKYMTLSLYTVDQKIRLVGGSVSREGRVEVRNECHDEWGTVCDDLFGTTDAQVACRQLGYGTDTVTVYSSGTFGRGTGDILLDNLGCTGRENSLFECRHNGIGIHDCGHSEDVSISCPCKQLL